MNELFLMEIKIAKFIKKKKKNYIISWFCVQLSKEKATIILLTH